MARKVHRKLPLDTLRISNRQWHTLVSQLERQVAPFKGTDRRGHHRQRFEQIVMLVVRLNHTDGSTSTYAVRSRNISTGGIGFLHGTYIHTGTRCHILLKDNNSHSVQLTGTVVRCHLLHSHVHDVGIRFHQEIDPSSLLHHQPASHSDPHRGRGFSPSRVNPYESSHTPSTPPALDTHTPHRGSP